MKYWTKGRTEYGHGEEGILLNCESDRLISVRKSENGFTMTEECDGWFSEEFTKSQMLELIQELKDWVNSA